MNEKACDRKKVAELTDQGIDKSHAYEMTPEHIRNLQDGDNKVAQHAAQKISEFFQQEYEENDTQIDEFMGKLRKSLSGLTDQQEEQNLDRPLLQKEYDERQIRRICLYGGPGSGKSQTAAWLYSALKERFIQSDSGIHIEQAQEYVKRWAYQGVKIDHFDQIYIFGKQMRTVHVPLRNGVDLVITDSPIPMQVCFSYSNGLPYAKDLESQAMWFEKAYPAIHIFVGRDGRKYYPGGRYLSEAEALEIDRNIKHNVSRMLREYSDNGRLSHRPKLWEVSYKDKESMLDLILKNLQNG